MARDINLNSESWTNLVFEGKNKEYGAYVLRETSSDRHLKALIIVAFIGLLLVYLPSLIKSAISNETTTVQTTGVELIDLDLKNDLPEENQIKQIEVVPPPPLLKETIQFTPPVIRKDNEVRTEELMLTQQELTDTKVDISVATIAGAKEGTVDIADIIDHKVVVQEEKKPEIFSHVEVKPQFPGGEMELIKWISDNINYPVIAQEQNIQGRVVLRFVVRPDGSVDDVIIQRSLDPSCDKEAIRVVKKMPKWIPGKQNGNPVYVYYTLPIQFKLQ